MNRFFTLIALLCVFISQLQAQVLRGKIICVDPGHGGTAATDSYRVDPSGEREASVLRNTYGIPAVLAEASFFTNADEEQRLKSASYNQLEAEAYLEAIRAFLANLFPRLSPEIR